MQQGGEGVAAQAFQRRRMPVVQRQRRVFLLQLQARLALHQALQHLGGHPQVGRVHTMQLAAAVAAAGAVLAGQGQHQRVEKVVQLGHAAPRHDGQRTPQPQAQRLQQVGQNGWHPHQLGPGRDVHQGPVKVEEQGRAVGKAGQAMHRG